MVIFSDILFVRKCFDEDDYAKKSFDGVPVRILKAKSKDPMVQKITSYLVRAFDALEKRYLRKLKLVIYLDPEKPEQAHEVYSIKVSYHEGFPALDVVGLENLKHSTNSLLKTTLEGWWGV